MKYSYIELLHILGLALAYFIAGKLSLSLDNGDYFNAASIWPPSGIALAGILLYGYRAWPGILLGAFLINDLNPLTASLVSGNLNPALVSLIISSGTSLQAIAGAYLVRRYTGFPNALTREKDILLFLLNSALLSPLINSTLSVSTMAITGQIPAVDFLTSWGTWWLGDVFGILIFTPLSLVWLQQNNPDWHNRRLAITVPIGLMFILTITAISYEDRYENERIKLEFNQRAIGLNLALQASVLTHMNVLRSIESLYTSSESVSLSEFKSFIIHSLDDFQGIQALAWAPIIKASERDGFEKKFQQEGYLSFQITERDTDKTMIRAKDRPRYVPSTFLEPYQGNEKALGYDFNSNQERQEALNRATDTAELAITSQIELVQEKSGQLGIVAFFPVYRRDLPYKTLEQRRNAISSYIVGTFRISDILTKALKDQNLHNLSYRLIDETVPETEQLLFFSTAQEQQSWVQKGFLNTKDLLTNHSTLTIGGRIWGVEIMLTQNSLVYHHSVNAWMTLLAGLLLTSLVTMAALIASGRNRLLQKLVTERSYELEQQYEITHSVKKDNATVRARLELILNATGEGIFGIDIEGKCIFANRSALMMLGYTSQQDVLGKNNHQLFHHSHADGSDYKIDQCPIDNTLRGHLFKSMDSEVFWRKDGTCLQVEYQAYPIKDDNQIIGCVVSFIDITAHKQGKDQIRKLLLAVEQNPTVIVITDLNAKIEYVNEQFVKSSGYSREEVIGKNSRLLQSGKTPETTYIDMWATLGKGDNWRGELVNKSKQGTEYLESVLISPIRDSNEKITHYLAIKEDITERKQNESIVLLAKERAEALAISKTQFLANMSHEIRTPMNGIIGFSELALLKEMPADIRDYLTKINRASTNLLSILNDILDLSKLEANGVSLNLVLFDLDELRDTLYSLFAETAQNKSLIFNIKIPAQVPRQLIGDDLRLKQVLINLLSNAVKFTAIGAVSLDISLLDREASKTRLLFSVNDTGIGLSAQDQEKLFQPFTQADDSIARRFGGTGLGLALSHNLLQLMGSEFTVVSTPGLGSCFSFELVLDISATSHVAKAKQPLATTASALKDFASRLAGTQILVAEDNFFNQQIIQELLKLASIKVEIANNGAEALAMLESGEFDAILMDVHMPVMDGLEATQHIRRSSRFADIPVIALTAGVTQAEREQCLASGMNDFINKPINMTQLLSTLAQWTKPQHL